MSKHSPCILIVEDIPNILDYLTVTLRFHGYTVISAHNGEEALQAIEQYRPDLVITDILMPKMDGFALAHILRGNPATEAVPIVFLSATYTSSADRDFALRIGAEHFIEKPVDTENLLLTIGEILASSAASSRNVLDDHTFYLGYRERLQNKLIHKDAQIARTERLLQTLPDEQKPAFQSLLEESLKEREIIQAELEQVQHKLGNTKS